MPLDEGLYADAWASFDVAIGKGGADPLVDLDIACEGADGLDFRRNFVEVELSTGGGQDGFGQNCKMPEAVVPVADALGAIAVIGKTFEKE